MAQDIGIFESTPGNTSSMRVIFVIGMIWSIAMTTVGILMLHWLPLDAMGFLGGTSAIFIGGKVSQKAMEKPDKNGTDTTQN